MLIEMDEAPPPKNLVMTNVAKLFANAVENRKICKLLVRNGSTGYDYVPQTRYRRESNLAYGQ